jgi:hypothetical protein
MSRHKKAWHDGLVAHLSLLDNFFSDKETGMEKHITTAEKLGLIDALILSPQDNFSPAGPF